MNHLWNDLAYILFFFWINFFSIKIFEKTFKFRWYLRKIEFPILKRICVKNIIFTRHIFFKYDYESWTSSFDSYAKNYLLSLIYKVICIPILYSFKLRTKWLIFQIVHVFIFLILHRKVLIVIMIQDVSWFIATLTFIFGSNSYQFQMLNYQFSVFGDLKSFNISHLNDISLKLSFTSRLNYGETEWSTYKGWSKRNVTLCTASHGSWIVIKMIHKIYPNQNVNSNEKLETISLNN